VFKGHLVAEIRRGAARMISTRSRVDVSKCLFLAPIIKYPLKINLMSKSTKIIVAVLITPIVVSLFILILIFTNPRLQDSPDYHTKEFAGYFVREFSFQPELLYSSYKVKFKNEKDTTKERNVVHIGFLGNFIKISDKNS